VTKPTKAAAKGLITPAGHAHRFAQRTATPVAGPVPPPEPAPTLTGNRALRAAGQLLDAQKSLLSKGLRALTPLTAFEDVFDQRVAAALQRLAMTRAGEIEQLREQIAELRRRLDRISSKPRSRGGL
jgi:poly(hydroxyalkanoate) granule associated protein phasin